MSVPALRELLTNEAQLMPLTVDQYDQMIATGILPEGEPYELLDGFVVRKDRSATGAQKLELQTSMGKKLSVAVKSLLP